jgi:hypothetical protein
MTRVLLAVAALLPPAAGCGGPAAPRPVPVRGAVLYNGKGLCPARIYFQPTGPDGRQAYAELQLDGTFALKTADAGDGAVPGAYKVTLSVGLGNPPDLAGYDEKDRTPITVTVPPDGLSDLTISVPLKK